VHLTVGGVVAAERGRLVDRVEGWDRGVAGELARVCAERTQRLASATADDRLAGYAEDAVQFAADTKTAQDAAVVGFVAAYAAGLDEPGAFRAERAWQSSWLAERLGLA
jgi:hypothetical protein